MWTPEYNDNAPMEERDEYGEILDELDRGRYNKYAIAGAFQHLMNYEMSVITTELAQRDLQCVGITDLNTSTVNDLANLTREEIQNSRLFEWLLCSFSKAYIVPDYSNVRAHTQAGNVWASVANTNQQRRRHGLFEDHQKS